MSWHAVPDLLERYAAGILDEARAYSVEAHIGACAPCRGKVAGLVDAELLDRLWDGVLSRATPFRVRAFERLVVRVGVPEHVARLLAATPSLRLSWFVAVAFALGFAVLAAHGGDAGTLLFLVVAPLVPLAGVAAAYGPGIDPTYEVGLAAPMRSHRLLLIRAVAVLATSVALAGLAALALPTLEWTAAAWLLPSLALSGSVLALSTSWSPMRAAATVGAAWIGLVSVVEIVSVEPLAVFRAGWQVGFLVLTAVAVVVVAGRREAFDTRRHL